MSITVDVKVANPWQAKSLSAGDEPIEHIDSRGDSRPTLRFAQRTSQETPGGISTSVSVERSSPNLAICNCFRVSAR